MKRRIIAWVLLIGFLALLINILIFGKYLMQSLFIYTIIALCFLFTNNIMKKSANKEENSEHEDDKDIIEEER